MSRRRALTGIVLSFLALAWSAAVHPFMLDDVADGEWTDSGPITTGSRLGEVPPFEPEIESSSYFSGDRSVALRIHLSKIGIQATPAAPNADVVELAAALHDYDLHLERLYGHNHYVFGVGDNLDQEELRQIARQLVAIDSANLVRIAGLVAETDTTSAPLILSDEILFGFSQPPPLPTDQFIEQFGLSVTDRVEGCEEIYVARQEQQEFRPIDQVALDMFATDEIAFAHPNFAMFMPERSAHVLDPPPVDPAYGGQWHHHNRGANGGTIDADIDSAEAWTISTGTRTSPLLAIIDSSFSVTAPDLVPNLWRHPFTQAPGRDFTDDSDEDLLGPLETLNTHGTSVASIAGASAGNAYGGRGVCPDCRMLLIRHASDVKSTTAAICYAVAQDAQVISNSWGADTPIESLARAIAYAADEKRVPVLFATASQTAEDNCHDPGELSALDDHVIAVSSVTYLDGRTPSGYGDCVDVLAPSRKRNNHGIMTTRVYRKQQRGQIGHETVAFFGGTSAATPMVSATIGLMLDVNPDLDREVIQRVLQDTADKVDPACAHYDIESGFSAPPNTSATHAYGRINALEAVALVAQSGDGQADFRTRGRDGRDLFIRDHALDWGNTERPSNELFTPTNPRRTTDIVNSPDIRIDVHPFGPGPTTSAQFAALESDELVPGRPFIVYVRVRNRGHADVQGATASLYWTPMSPLPRLVEGFWQAQQPLIGLPANYQSWNLAGSTGVPPVSYSGATAAGGRGLLDPAVIVDFHVQGLNWNETAGERVSLLVVAHSDQDPVVMRSGSSVPYDFLDPVTAAVWDNNVTVWAQAPDGERRPLNLGPCEATLRRGAPDDCCQ